ncbi:MAG: hypothetical protein JWQ84_870 [Mucilaginibacter sp.]|jgi:hypothetical protein|nr:hypothetical protein [Mucilaginibacter sp.]MDB5016038.1 hypothetical protein [Mucilaginibacter sp.]
MKPQLLYFSLLIVVFASGCIGNKNSAPAPLIPSGTFAGQFRRVHLNQTTGKRDTLSANIILTMNTTTGYAVTGDTTKLHAGSHGAYAIASSYIQFNDLTYSASAPQTKIHLVGTYQYYYDGTIFQMAGNSALDTLSYQYDLTTSK